MSAEVGGMRAGETTDEFTLRTVECIGGCGWATIVAVNNRHRLHVSADDVSRIVAELKGIPFEETVDETFDEEPNGDAD